MNLIYWLLYLLMIFSFGSLCLIICLKREETFQLEAFFGISGLFGGGIIFLIGLCSYFFEIEFSTGEFIFSAILFFVNSIILFKKKKILINTAIKKPNFIELFFIFLIVLQFCFILSQSFYRPVAMNDDWSHWAGKAKFLYYHGKIDKVFFDETNLSNYPMFLIIQEIMFCKIQGKWNDFTCKSVIIHFLLFFILLFYSVIKYDSNRLYALFWSFFVLTIPMYIRSGLDGTADNLYSLYLGSMIFCCYNFLNTKKNYYLFFFSIFASVLSSIKLEGIYPALICAFLMILLLYYKDKKMLLAFSLYTPLLILLFNLPWHFLKYFGECTASRIGYFSLSFLFEVKTYSEIFIMLKDFFTPSKLLSLSGLYFLITLILYLIFKRKTVQSSFVLLFILITSSVYVFGCYSTGWGEQFSRLLSHFTVVMVFFSAKELYCFISPLFDYKMLALKKN